VAPGKFLFALLSGTPRAWELFFPRQPLETLGDKMAGLVGQTRPLTPDQYPLLVTFGDINDPTSVRRVDPNDLAASFGPGYRLNAITMTITDEPVTEGKVETVLGWLPSLKGRLKPSTKKYADELTVEEKLYSMDFQRRN
jgi:hypothetical protein